MINFSGNEQEMSEFATKFVATLQQSPEHATVLGLSGELGSGKTTFTKAVAKILGVNEVVLSPTFVLAKYYQLSNRNWSELIHIDAYRIENENELSSLRWDEIINNPQNLILVEWPEKTGKRFPSFGDILSFKVINEITRQVVKLK